MIFGIVAIATYFKGSCIQYHMWLVGGILQSTDDAS